jgi:hypothetical protein
MYYIPIEPVSEYRTFVADLIVKFKAYLRLVRIKKSAGSMMKSVAQ